jgi:hypothetical protein
MSFRNLLRIGSDMPTFIVISGHSPESCPIHNEAAKKMTVEAGTKLGEIAKKYGIKIVGTYAVIPEHKSYMILDAPSADAFQKSMMEPFMIQFLGHNMTEIKLAIGLEEAMKMLQ